MKADLQKIKRYLKACKFTAIFNQELGWDNPLDAPYKIPYQEQFRANGPIWSLLRDHPDAYIYDAMVHGVLERLPPEIEAGRTDVTQRASWNQPAGEQWALPTETWLLLIRAKLQL